MENVLYSKMFDTNEHRHHTKLLGHGHMVHCSYFALCFSKLLVDKEPAPVCGRKIVSVENMVIEAIKTLLCYCGFWPEYVCLILNFAGVQRTTEVRAIEAEGRDIVFQYANFR